MRRFQSYSVENYLKLIRSMKISRAISEIHLHHTWQPTKKTYASSTDKEKVIYGMWRYHTETLGWKDIGQHITVSPDGLVWDGRNLNEIPASIQGHNQKAIAIEMIGNFDKGEEALEGAQLETVIKLLNGLFEIFNTKNLVFHRDHSSKTCPGTSITKEMLFSKINESENISIDIIEENKSLKQENEKLKVQLNSYREFVQRIYREIESVLKENK